jgi:hypothetical protein
VTRDDAIKLILRRCGDREDDTFLQQACVAEMQLAQEMVLEQADFKPWFLLSDFMRANTGALENRIPLPERFLEEHDEGLLWVREPSSGKYNPMARDDVDTLEEYYSETAPRLPERYGVAKNYIILFPTPDLAYPLKMRCYLKEVTLTYDYGAEADQAVKTNAWLTHAADWLIGETGRKIALLYLKDEVRANEFMAQARRLYVQHVAREEANRDRTAGDD